MRISDWSSDVCSSDLQKWAPSASSAGLGAFETVEDDRADSHTGGQPHIYATGNNWRFTMHTGDRDTSTDRHRQEVTGGSEELGVGHECVRTCRARWSPDHFKKQRTKYSNKNIT